MPKFFTFLLIVGILGLIGFSAYLLLFAPSQSVPQDQDADFPVAPQIDSTDWQPTGQQQIRPMPNMIGSYSGRAYSPEPITGNIDTREVAEGYFVNTTANDIYTISYHAPSGAVGIQLFDENLSLARGLAEGQLKKVFSSLTEDEICDMNIKVFTDEYVLPGYSGKNFGLSFCPFSTSL